MLQRKYYFLIFILILSIVSVFLFYNTEKIQQDNLATTLAQKDSSVWVGNSVYQIPIDTENEIGRAHV